MARSVGSRDQSGDDPTSSFAAPAPSHFDPSSYSFPIDTQLAMEPTYTLPQFARQLGEAASSVEHAAAQLTNLPAASNGNASGTATDPAMAPPQTSGQVSFMPTPTRQSIDDSSDPGHTPQTGDKRKRSKTSRACDECRRKKVRCDAPMEMDGTPKTCTNCQKAGVTCDFERKPMKRGPSKGYIKELAERVQQVEHVQKQALRQSLDAGSLAGYAETFSPDDSASAGRRHFSFPDPRNPFAPIDFQRDRIPSTGAWGSTGMRPRDNGSLAIAPDQFIPASAPGRDASKQPETVKPFWTELEPSPPPSRPRSDDPYAELEPLVVDRLHLSNYFKHVHPLFALLPNVETVNRVVQGSSAGLQHAFADVIALLPGANTPAVLNGNHADPAAARNDTVTQLLKSDLPSRTFENSKELTSYIVKLAQEGTITGWDRGSLVCVWVLLLLAVLCENDVTHIQGLEVTKTDLINSSLRLLESVREDDAASYAPDMDKPQFDSLHRQAFNCACLLSKLHALSLGTSSREFSTSDDPNSGTMVGYVDIANVPSEAGFLTHASNTIAMASCLLHIDPYSPVGAQVKRILTFTLFEDTLKRYRPLDLQSPIVQHTKLFLDLLMSRHPDNEYSVMTVLLKASQLTDYLVSDPRSSSSYNPVDMHSWSLATITCCEFAMHARDETYTKPAVENLDRLRIALQKRSESFHQDYGHSWFWAPSKAMTDGYKMSHWADCLSNMIDDIRVRATTREEGGGDGEGDKTAVLPNLSLLLAGGWFRVLYHYRVKDESRV
ncbi:hypothetical protein LTR10_019154 [Elasticomyces elasticus]|uniref:Zn(2)-C6 fungal-type domain-containing protein n=1 Tax=Exophiala sideris TaxID=1016849 RepID=A0ABR0J8W2_9EURO|nr:hypothetical protein LTR10_019154 [Elasticomyces elasticus]KAK5025474.1 hypothetical protein LTR13_010438 [Exophiala sideris]KAK5029746.1 hypothetical protein LTS07_005470 [Exophiala sideris]KAK5058492.1 hypothetical protein LTR69_006897 [Exophiala sideris]KAK5178535.1 hypothetical protein LTR44_008906 [Eurotiomycetes sp. CCFEE 6388]